VDNGGYQPFFYGKILVCQVDVRRGRSTDCVIYLGLGFGGSSAMMEIQLRLTNWSKICMGILCTYVNVVWKLSRVVILSLVFFYVQALHKHRNGCAAVAHIAFG